MRENQIIRVASSACNPLVAPAGEAAQSPADRASYQAQRRARRDAADRFGSLMRTDQILSQGPFRAGRRGLGAV